MIFVTATAAARDQGRLVTAGNLYQGSCLPHLRERLADHPQHCGPAPGHAPAERQAPIRIRRSAQ
jgi:hypothetical protein